MFSIILLPSDIKSFLRLSASLRKAAIALPIEPNTRQDKQIVSIGLKDNSIRFYAAAIDEISPRYSINYLS